MKRMLVTGASGFLGSRIVDFFQEKYEIYAPRHQEMEITDEEKVMQVLEKYKPDIVIHCAAISDVGQCEKEPEKSWKINVDGSINIARAAGKIQAKCILCSSDQVYFGSSVKEAHKEEETLQPCNVYGQEKLRAEQECLKVNPDCVLLRLSWMYDTKTMCDGEHGDFIKTLFLNIRNAEPLSYPVHDRRGITDVNEVLQNLEKTFEIPGGVYNFGSPNDLDTYTTVGEAFKNAGLDAKNLQKNELAFQSNPRNLSMCQEKAFNCGIVFSSTVSGVSENLKGLLNDEGCCLPASSAGEGTDDKR
ncbi:MAG: NAD(P)-dependent oxidoreductase [Lachnospiraceae bacterium]|nr:NAD(P)-dependent oxidoreductase [Lachnospiraceae bacterium]